MLALNKPSGWLTEGGDAREDGLEQFATRHSGQPAVSTFHVLGRAPDGARTWLAVLLQTGRTHQARLHAAHAGHPIAGDPLYGSGARADFFGLHARELALRHHATGSALKITAPPPANWRLAVAAVWVERPQ